MASPSVTDPPGELTYEADVLLGVLGRQEEELGADLVGHRLVDGAAQEDDPLLEEALEDVGRGQVGQVAGPHGSRPGSATRAMPGVGWGAMPRGYPGCHARVGQGAGCGR